MNFTDDQIVITPGHFCRDFQTCDYSVNGIPLFHERTFHIKIYGKGGFLSRLLDANTQAERDAIASEDDKHKQWFYFLASKEVIEALAKKYGGYAHEEFYPQDEAAPLYFLAFEDTEKALAFCRTEDFDKYSLTMEKI